MKAPFETIPRNLLLHITSATSCGNPPVLTSSRSTRIGSLHTSVLPPPGPRLCCLYICALYTYVPPTGHPIGVPSAQCCAYRHLASRCTLHHCQHRRTLQRRRPRNDRLVVAQIGAGTGALAEVGSYGSVEDFWRWERVAMLGGCAFQASSESGHHITDSQTRWPQVSTRLSFVPHDDHDPQARPADNVRSTILFVIALP